MLNQPNQARTILLSHSSSSCGLCPSLTPHVTESQCHIHVFLPCSIQGTVVTGFLTFQDSKNAVFSINEWHPKTCIMAPKKVVKRDNVIWKLILIQKTTQTLWWSYLVSAGHACLRSHWKLRNFPRLSYRVVCLTISIFWAKNAYR